LILITLYTGTGCHLCQLAADILDDVVGPRAYRTINITGDEHLMKIYGTRIPVVKNAAGREHNWPFTAGQVKKLVAHCE
jgi:hypothetical protein